VRCYWELFEEHVKNLGTLCFDSPPPKKKKEKRKKLDMESEQWTVHSPHKSLLDDQETPRPPPKRKEMPLHSMMQLLICCMEILFLKLAATIFGLD
jgi:hypothetical protein